MIFLSCVRLNKRFETILFKHNPSLNMRIVILFICEHYLIIKIAEVHKLETHTKNNKYKTLLTLQRTTIVIS